MSSPASSLILEPGTLWSKICHQTEHGLQCGALQPIATHYEWVAQGQMQFLVRILDNLVRKEKSLTQQTTQRGPSFNPFLPYEADLFVTDISQTHLCLLNKFNVVDHHSLIITRTFAAQENWLTFRDFEALWACLQEVDGLAFYNGGKVAGASQRHKHLQLVPLPMVPQIMQPQTMQPQTMQPQTMQPQSMQPQTMQPQTMQPQSMVPQPMVPQSLSKDTPCRVPIEAAIAVVMPLSTTTASTIPSLPFRHSVIGLALDPQASPSTCAEQILATYDQLLTAVGFPVVGEVQTGAYNLLMTRHWMMIVPRSQEEYAGIPVNALGFAGSFLVKDAAQMAQLKQLKPLDILQQVGSPR